MADAQLSGERIAYHRKRLGLSQAQAVADAVTASPEQQAVELGDAGQALDLARHVRPGRLPAERQARYNIDLAQAHAMRRQIDEALRCLGEAEKLTPEQTRTRRVARAVARDLIRLSGSRPRPELRELAERFGVLP